MNTDTVKFELPANSLNGMRKLSGDGEIDRLNGIHIGHFAYGPVDLFSSDSRVMGFLQEGFILNSDYDIPFNIFLSESIFFQNKI